MMEVIKFKVDIFDEQHKVNKTIGNKILNFWKRIDGIFLD